MKELNKRLQRLVRAQYESYESNADLQKQFDLLIKEAGFYGLELKYGTRTKFIFKKKKVEAV
jgi:hypothetical protein